MASVEGDVSTTGSSKGMNPDVAAKLAINTRKNMERKSEIVFNMMQTGGRKMFTPKGHSQRLYAMQPKHKGVLSSKVIE